MKDDVIYNLRRSLSKDLILQLEFWMACKDQIRLRSRFPFIPSFEPSLCSFIFVRIRFGIDLQAAALGLIPLSIFCSSEL